MRTKSTLIYKSHSPIQKCSSIKRIPFQKTKKKKTNKIFIHSQTELGPQLHESKNDLLVEVILITRTSVVSLTPKFFLINIKI